MWNERRELQELVLRCVTVKYENIYHQLETDANKRPIRICLDCIDIPILVEGHFRLGDDGKYLSGSIYVRGQDEGKTACRNCGQQAFCFRYSVHIGGYGYTEPEPDSVYIMGMSGTFLGQPIKLHGTHGMYPANTFYHVEILPTGQRIELLRSQFQLSPTLTYQIWRDDGIAEMTFVEGDIRYNMRQHAIGRMIEHWKEAQPAHAEILDRGGHEPLHHQQWKHGDFPQFYIKMVQKP